jgi:hypothetical protein
MDEHFNDETGAVRCDLCGDRLPDSQRAKRTHLLRRHRSWELEF